LTLWLVHVAAALAAVYLLGYVTGSLLVERRAGDDSIAWTIIRLLAGLLLSTIAFFVSLRLSMPWYVGPAVVMTAAVAMRGRAAFVVPAIRLHPRWPGVAAAIPAAILVSPLALGAMRMAPGDFAPVFYNVDSAYFLEQVHSLAQTTTYPPESLSNAGGRRAYHFGTHGMAALISRSSGLKPHTSIFGIVLPLLTVGILAAAVAAARAVSPAVPLYLSVPLLLIGVPSFLYSFWAEVGPRLWSAWSSPQPWAQIAPVLESYELWGVASNSGQNLGAHFLVLASLAAIATAPARGWRLAVFLIGTGILVKTSTGVALVAGFALTQLWPVLTFRRPWPPAPLFAVVAVFLAIYIPLFMTPMPPDFQTELSPLFHLTRYSERNLLGGLGLDVAWVLLPLLVLAPWKAGEKSAPTLPLLLMSVAPFVVVNVTRSIDVRPGGGGPTDDWLQVMLAVPFLLHAFVLAFASQRWRRLNLGSRVVFGVLIALAVLPVVVVAGRYSQVLIRDHENGHEFVDNRSIAAALAAIPRDGSLIVTNDLRYPAQRFSRDNRQMQIPALFGHQAFAVNYAYEIFPFTSERRELQKLLQAGQWSDAITNAARAHGWTHLIIRKDYMHPTPVPLEQIFDNESYAVYRFGEADRLKPPS
jgi:hypothetical protein